jgi:hypothetical protein
LIKNGVLENGVIDDKIFGVENGNIIRELDSQVGRETTLETIRTVFALGTKYLSK